MKPRGMLSFMSVNAVTLPAPLDLIVPCSILCDGLREGDIVTLGAPGNLARDERTGIPVPLNQRFRVVGKAEGTA